MLICHEMKRGNEFHLYGTEEIGSRFLSHQGDCIQRLFHFFCTANSSKSQTTAATVTTGQNDNITVQPSATPFDIQTGHDKIEPIQTRQTQTGQNPTTTNLTGQNPTTPNPLGPNPTTPNLTGQKPRDKTEQHQLT